MPATQKSPQVDYIRTEIIDLTPRYDLIRDAVAGQTQIKRHGEKYLPKPNKDDTSAENKTRYDQYVERAIFYGVTGRTLSGLIGEVFEKDPAVTIPSGLDILKQDVDGGGVALDQQTKKALSLTLAYGRCGLLVDYPRVSGPATKADIDSGKIRPTINLWQPWDVINWRVTTIGGQKLLTLVVISEQWVIDDDGFVAECDQQYRVLRLSPEGEYYVEIWKKAEAESGVPNGGMSFYLAEEPFTPLDASGNPWKFIPFTFIGAENNDPTPDLPPLFDLASLNVGHYRNSADYEEACFMLGQPTTVATGLSEDWVSDVLKGTIKVGSRGLIPLPVGGDAKILQVAPNTMPKEAMEHKEAQMVALGAKLIEQKTVQQTATEAGINKASETSILATCAKNVATAYTNALKWAAAFIGVPDTEITYALSADFGAKFSTAQDRAQLMAEFQGNLISRTEMRTGLKRIGVAFQDDEEYQAEVDAAGPDMGLPVRAAEMEAAQQAAKLKADAAKAGAKSKQNPPAA